jgi:L-threonylcarbamoyladenylate synthase
MNMFTDMNDSAVVDFLCNGKIGVVRTDTLYGLVGLARDASAVERIFQVKGRSPTKPVLVLISNEKELFDPYDTSAFIGDLWPGKNTIILPSPHAPEWVTRGGGSVAYRLPADIELVELVSKVGPLIAPSANPEGGEPARTIQQAVEYFGDSVDFYVDGGEVTDNTPSALLHPRADGMMERLR